MFTVEAGKVVNVNMNDDSGFEVYREVHGHGFATLIRNEDFVPDQNDHPFRMVISSQITLLLKY